MRLVPNQCYLKTNWEKPKREQKGIMKKVKENVRVYAILQRNDDDTVELCGCYTDYNVAEKICKRLNKIYTQEYYIVDTLLDFDYQKGKSTIKGE
jgi:hypothetical protein